MDRKKEIQKGDLKAQTAIVFICIAFAIGFVSGVALTIYKSGSRLPAQAEKYSGRDMEQMAEALEAEAARNPQNAATWARRGTSYFDSNQYEKAIRAYEKSIEIDPNNADLLTHLGIMYRRTGRPRKAIEYFDKAVAVDPKHENARFNKGIVLMQDLNDRDAAIRVWEELLEINPLAMAGNEQSVDQLVKHYKEHVKDTSN